MIKHYLIPAEIVIEDGESNRVPKYINDLKINWAGVYVEAKDVYILVVNEGKDLTKLDELEKQAEVILLNGERKTKDDLKTKLGLTEKIKDTEDEVEVIARLQEPNFTKDKIFVSD